MELIPGTKLGPYEIVAPVGAGGMGEVFKARDTRLDRTVAIKVMPRYIAAREDLRARFEREARTVSNLKHPHICVLYDIGKQDGTDFMVLEFLEGETLAARIAKGPMPLDQALKYATQIADALDRAHRSGVSHRDVKPANVMITRDGCKVLDFGLAKTAPRIISPDDATLTVAALTSEGTILGTPQYMAPEQYEGKEADARSDIFAFGCLLYEMVTGKRCFEGKTRASLIAAVLGAEPISMSALVPVTPTALERLVRRCLAKDPEDRYQSIRDVVLELQEIQRGGMDYPVSTKILSGRPLIAALAMLAVALCVALWSPWRSERQADRPLVRLDVDLGSDVSLASTVAISPAGTRLAYVSGTPASLFTRELDQPKATELPGTQGASAPFFSPDGQWVGFATPSRLNKISVSGGAVVPLGEVGANFAGANWGEDGSIFVSVAFQRGLQRIPAGGGTPEIVAGLGEGEVGLISPQILPGDKAILFSVNKAMGVDRDTIEVLTLADRHRKIVVRGGSFPRYLATSDGLGHLVYVNKGTLFGILFDPAKLETRGTAVRILDDVANTQFDFSPAPAGHGTLVYRKASGSGTGLRALQWVDSNGKTEPLHAKPGFYSNPSLSPDGKRVALTVLEGGSPDVWVYDPQRDAMTRLTFGGASYRWPAWSGDGQYVVFTSDGRGMFQARADGAGQPQPLTQGKPFQFPCSSTSDGTRLAYFETAGTYQIWTVPVADTGGLLKAGKPEQFLKTGFNDVFPAFSPDGRWLAYRSDESGKYEVYVRTFPPPSSGQGGKWQVSNNSGGSPRWPRNGHDLFYQSGDQIMAAAYTVKNDTFVAEKPRVWLDKPGLTQGGWDVTPDGKRLLMLTPVDSLHAPKQEHELVFLENFFDELKRKVPAGK